ncbi:hypothetical protein [Dactylosporangium sp. NPDC050588]|uniref:hypothetical protein n=1 Tax=Dactylosporangium sp. NPDC050588 TaxID=3157211 RepID=UPI00340A3AAE
MVDVLDDVAELVGPDAVVVWSASTVSVAAAAKAGVTTDTTTVNVIANSSGNGS